MELKKKNIVPMLAIAFGLLMLIPTSGMLSAQAAAPTEMVLVDSSHVSQLQSLGAEIFVDYGNGRYLMKMPAVSVSEIPAMDGILPLSGSGRMKLNLYPSQYKFDPSQGLPSIASNMMTSYAAGQKGEYIVQFVGPVKSEWVNSIRNAGATPYRDLGGYGMVVKMTPETAAKVSSFQEVAWVGVYQPAYKIPAGIDVNSNDTSLISVAVYNDVSAQDVANQINALGITVVQVMKSNVIISVPGSMLPEVAKLPGVEYMGTYSIPKPLDLHADYIIHARELWYPSYNPYNTRFIGEGQVVGIQDTGFDNGASGKNATPSVNDHIRGPLGNRVVRYKDEGGSSDPDGNNDGIAHGSHCCGLISGNGYSWEEQYGYSVSDYNWDHAESVGTAPGAKLSADGIMASSGSSGGASLSPSTNYWDTEQNDGAQIYSNSWGDNPGDYDSTFSKTVDDNANTDNRRLALFGAGNSGPGRDTLNPDSQAKDGLCIGASSNFRPLEWSGDTNSTVIADFSSRGGTFSDTRIKPDLVSPGTSGISLNAKGEYDYYKGSNSAWIWAVDQYDWDNETNRPDGKPDYQYMDGTSVSVSISAGSAAVVRGFLADTGYNSDPTSQIIKALLINGASRMPNMMYPGYDQGWGRINLKNSLIPDAPTVLQYTEGTMSSTGTWDAASDGGMHLDVKSGDVPLKITLTWIDTSGVDLNRNLDLYVQAPNGVWYHGNAYGQDGWTMANTTVANSADQFIGSWDKGSGYDAVNNVEQVEVQNPMAGTWTVHVIGANVPSATPFALVVRADIGSLAPAHAIKNEILGGQTVIRATPGGSATIPMTVTNFGTASDTVQMSDTLPSGITSTYSIGGTAQTSYSLASGESKTLVMTVNVDSSVSPGTYDFSVFATSSSDTNIKSVTDMRLEVIDPSVKIARSVPVSDSSSASEMYPSVTTFTDHNGVSWIFVAYLQTFPVSSDAKFGGDAVMVKYAQIGSDGMPEQWQGPIRLTTLYENPNDIRITHATSSASDPYQDRVWIVWTGDDPNATHDAGKGSKGSWGRIAWADNSDYSSWICPATGHNTTIDENSGSEVYNLKRVNSLQYRASAHQLLYVFDHVDYDSNGQIQAVHDGYTTSTDGGSTWATAADSDPGGDYFFFPNIMDGGDDYNDVVWMYVYHRGSSGNDRDLSCRVFDGSWGADSNGSTKDTDVLDNPNNLMFPVVAYDKSSGSNNDVYFAVLNETKLHYRIIIGHHSGAVSSSNPPADTNNAWGTVKGPFATSVSAVNYERGPLINMISTPQDGGMWVQYLEKATPLGANIMALYSDDGFSSASYHTITSNSYPKGHEMSSSVDIGGTDYIYTVYHMTKGEYDATDYNIYLAVYHDGYENDPDTYAPDILRSVATPATNDNGVYHLDLGANPSFEISATADDGDQGRSAISSAEWSYDGSTWHSMNLDGNTVVEKMSVVLSPSWCVGAHTVYIRTTDAAGNTNQETMNFYVDVPPHVTVNFNSGWNLVSLPWLKTPTDLNTALSGISWDRAMVYQNGQWYTYNANRDAKFNVGFPDIDNSMGIWVHTTAAGSITHDICGMSTYQMNLQPGWNLVSYVSQTSRSISDAMAGFTGSYDHVEAFNGTAVVDASTMELGEGYWIHVTSAGTWSVDW